MKPMIEKAKKLLKRQSRASSNNSKLVNQKSKQDYFVKAKSWADECMTQREVTLSWFKLGFGLSMGLNLLLVISVLGLSSIQTLVPLVVHHYDNGVTTVEAIKEQSPHNRAQVESDLVRYIQTRESYDPNAYKVQFDLTALLSNEQVANEYQREQQKSNPVSPINRLGLQKIRKVHVYDIHFLDNVINNTSQAKEDKSHHNLAEAVFTVTDLDKQTGQSKTTSMTALISWNYRGTPKSPSERWKNWSGFKVISYQTQQRNVEHNV